MTDQEYEILEVQRRKEWTGKHGTFQDYALRLDKADGWTALTQKPETPAPVVGNKLFGHLETQQVGDNTFQKFKKVQQDGGGSYQQPSAGSNNNQDIKYIIEMLEELTGRRTKDVAPTDIPEDEPFDLDEIPF